MSRESKFRVWDSINNKWLLGYEHPNLGGFSMKGETMASGEYSKMLCSYSLADWDKLILTESVDLKDVKGRDVFEGDIVRYDTEDGVCISKVVWKNAEDDGLLICGYFFEFIRHEENYDEDEAVELEVIGNIFEHPELLEAE